MTKRIEKLRGEVAITVIDEDAEVAGFYRGEAVEAVLRTLEERGTPSKTRGSRACNPRI
jgi:hypothetical protein